MRFRLVAILLVMTVGVARGYTAWNLVNERYNVGDYEGMRLVLDTTNVATYKDSVLWLNWMGEYYYWLSYENKSCADTARAMFESAIRCGKTNRVSMMPYGYCYLHLGELSYLAGRYDEGIANLRQALANFPYRSRYNPRDPSAVYKGLGMCYAMTGRYDDALAYLDSCSGGTKGAYSAVRMKGKVYAMKGDTASSLKCYDEFVRSIQEEVRDSFLRLNARDRESWWMSVRPFITDCWRLERAAPSLLYDVALITKGILLQQNSALGITHDDIHKALQPGNVAIEWMVYENRGEKQLGAVVMRSDGSVRFVRTGSVGQFMEWWEDGDDIFNNYECKAAIWSDEMMEAIGAADRIYFAPDGIFNQIGIEYMFPHDSVRLFRLTSTRELLKHHERNLQSAAVFGGVDYDTAMADSGEIYNDEEAYRHVRRLGMKFKRLAFSVRECDSIFASRHIAADTLVLARNATERNFRQMAGQYDLLHISTHGYCRTAVRYESSDFPRRDLVDHSLSESGLIFCGYNAQQRERTSMTDGIVSARELCGMDLGRVGLCVVSACEGALGRESVDGTYGIQRGLKAAGVGSMILSSWEVDDLATTLFMTYLYQAMGEGRDVHQAFWEARRLLREREVVVQEADPSDPDSRPKVKRFFSPHYYNAFILIDETANGH